MSRRESIALITAACGLALAGSAQAQTVINITGATLFENFFRAPASTNDYIDVDGDGLARINATDDQLAPFGLPPALGTGQNGQWWIVQYRETGSVFGLQELIDWGTVFAHGDATTGPIPAITSSKSFCNRTQFIAAGLQSNGIFNGANPGANPCNANETTLQATYTIPGNPSPGGFRADIAPLDVPTLWAVQKTGGSAAPVRLPNQGGYGANTRRSVNAQGTSTGSNFPNTLASLGARNLYDPSNPGSANADTIFDTQVAAVPIAIITNLGTGVSQMKQSEVRHLFATGRTVTGENLTAVTRDSGSGTRNGAMNSVGLDPSWAVGENVGGQDGVGGSVLANEHVLGPNYVPGNKVGSGDMETTMFNTRLGVGYTGAERGVNNTWLTGGRLELLAIQGDLSGGTTYARPVTNNILNNDANGYTIFGLETFATIGDPRSAPANKGGDPGNTNPDMPNVEAAAYTNNITRSVEAFANAPGSDPTLFTPGEFLATQYMLVAATGFVHNLTNPVNLIPNPALNVPLRSFTQTNPSQVYNNAAYASFGTITLNGKVPSRLVLSGGATYSDGVVNGTNYINQGGVAVNYSANLTDRNRIAGDFNGDGKRDVNDVLEMMKAYRSRNGGPTWVAPNGTGAIAGAPGTDAVIEILGDFNGDGSFDVKDVRYFADGLAMDANTGKLDRHAGFLAVDNAWQTLTGNNNFFGTTIAGGRPYHAGDSAADVAGAAGIARGWAPVGADGVIDNQDVTYIRAQFIGNSFITDGHANWDNISEAVGFDLSADMTGDLIVDQADLDAINAILGTGTCYANCDGSTIPPVLNVNDFICFQSAFAAGDSYANCDGSTIPPVLNVNDFICFQGQFAAGCP